MKYFFGKVIIIALGGSVIFPEKIDWRFLKKFKDFIKSWLKEKKFIIIAGGGRLSRVYQEAASKISLITNKDKDWLGIHATRSNAHLLRTIFREVADPMVIDSRFKIKKLRYPVTIASGWRPGFSTDYIAIRLASDFKIREVVIAGRPDYVYTRDHQIYKSAKPVRQLTWSEYRRMIPVKWQPGSHAPVDPVASRLAQKEKIKAIVIDGKNLNNFDNLFKCRNFRGSIIS